MDNANLLLEQSELPTQETLHFEYDALETEMRSVVQQHANDIKMIIRRTTQDIIHIGEKLIEVKKQLGHGNFRKWLRFEFGWSVSTATKFMQVAEQFKCVNFTHLNFTASTLYLLAAPSTPKEVRFEVLERASNGENIAYTEAKKIISQYKENKKQAVKPKAQEDTPDDATQTVISMENVVANSNNISDTAITEMAIMITNLTPDELFTLVTKAVNNGLSNSHLSAIIMASQQALDTQLCTCLS